MKNILILAAIFFGMFATASTVQAQSIEIVNESFQHIEGYYDWMDFDWLTFDIVGDTGGVPMMMHFGPQVPGSFDTRWGRWYIVNGAFNIHAQIPCAWNGVITHQDSYLVTAELRTYSLYNIGNLVVDDVSIFNHD